MRQDATPDFNGDESFKYLLKQTSFGPRNIGSTGHKNCLEYLHTEFSKFSDTVIKDSFTHFDKDKSKYFKFTNLIAKFKGKDDTAPKIILAAHWDTRSTAENEKTSENIAKPILGANDGASGVAVLLEIAKIFSKFPPPVPVEIVLFDGEDYGKNGSVELIGSSKYALDYKGEAVSFGILIDMIGDKNLRIPKERTSYEMLTELTNKVWKRARELKLREFKNNVGDYIRDDHIPLMNVGIPIINLIDFDYPEWHTLNDTPDKCSPKSLETIGTLLLSLVYSGLDN